MIGFKFDGKHSSQFNVGFRSTDRTAIPERRKKEFTILGRSGTLELESYEYEKRYIKCTIGIMYVDKFEELRAKIREIAGWLSGSGLLIFDDEPGKAYEASVYSAVGIEQLALQPRGTMEIEFECQPFAVSTDLNRITKLGKNETNISIKNKGNVKTCGTFIIKNTGSTNVTSLRITRKVVI
ncbi:MAG: phage tail family protein [Peptoniphilus sp.]|uniref:distal tail protein Dit n=1 Tax=Peptoniphilus sp. TaxID=1971214 RepID=UPI002A75F8C6|nr:distal tail protein Dit [Peptoniphilus sp.]MDY2986138.1 phage tail family protein [Peptoniphilus sp.]